MDDDQKYLRRLMADERKFKDAGEAIFEKAQLEGRDLTDDERSEAEGIAARYKDAQAATARAVDDAKLAKAFAEPHDPSPLGVDFGTSSDNVPGTRPQGGTLGDAIVASGVWKSAKKAKEGDHLPREFKSGTVSIPLRNIGRKAADSPLLESNATSLFGDGSTAGPITTMLSGVETPGLVQLPPRIADLLPVVPITQGNSATYRILKDRDVAGYPGELPIAEAAQKPTDQYEFDVVTVPLVKFAAISKISDEWLEDDAATVAFVNADMPAQLRQAEDAYLAAILYTNVTDATSLGSGTTTFDEIAAAIAQIQAAGFNPNGVLITPADYWDMQVAKFGSGAGDLGYVSGGPFGSRGDPWGLRWVVDPNASSGHPLVGDFTRGAYIQRKGGLRFDSTNSNDDDFEFNLVTLRVEMREACQVVYPEAFASADIGS